MKICTVEGCESKIFQKGLCSKHYSRMKRHGTTEIDNPRMSNKGKTCLVDGCERNATKKGLCEYHYMQLIKGEKVIEEMTPLIKQEPICSVDGCITKTNSKGLCTHHYNKKYYASEKGKTSLKNYSSSEKGKERDTRSRHKRRVAIYSGGYEVFNHFEVYDRDLWICGICGLPVDKDLVYPEPMSASLDHIIPISKNGSHSFDNCQLAHLVCNVRKGNRIKENPDESVSSA